MHTKKLLCSVMCQLPTGTNYRKSRANYRHIAYVWSTDKFTERGRAISGRSIEAHPPEFNFARFLDSEAFEGYLSLFRLQITIIVAVRLCFWMYVGSSSRRSKIRVPKTTRN